MKKIIYIISAIVLLCGCSNKPQDNNKIPEETISREELLLNYAKKQFVGDKYQLTEENLPYMYEIPLRIIIMDTNSASTFTGCDEGKTNVQYFFYQDDDNNIIGNIRINIVCPDQNESHMYNSLDNYNQKVN